MRSTRKTSPCVVWAVGLLVLLSMQSISTTEPESFDRPNILWLTFEDSSYNHVSAYGNPYSNMPTLDGLAERGIRFTQARSTAPHCSPARSTLISGTPATTYGTDWHRKDWKVPHDRYYFPERLQNAGYYTTNNRKTDYNAEGWHRRKQEIWSRQGRNASYNNDAREEGQPFFSVFNQTSTHMGRIRSFHLEGRRDFEGFDVDSITPPDYVPDLEGTRSDYGSELEGLTDLDRWIAQFVKDLKERNLYSETIIFVFSDHGGPLPRAKGYPYDAGLRVPLVIHVPDKWKDRIGLRMGQSSNRLVGFEDLGPTVLRLAGLDVPDYMEGRDVLTTSAEPKQYQFNFRTNHGHHFYPARTVTDGTFHYIRFYMPHKPLGLRQMYQWGCPGYQAWDRYYHNKPEQTPSEYARWFQPRPTEYLFHLQKDPDELKNLANDQEYREVLLRMRNQVSRRLRETNDLGFFPKTTRGHDRPLYEWVRETDFPLEKLHKAAEIASQGNPENTDRLIDYLKSEHPSIRFWGASGFATLGQRGEINQAPSALLRATNDANPEVAVTAAEALCYLGRKKRGMNVILQRLRQEDTFPAASSLQGLAEIRPSVVKPYVDPLTEMTDNQKVRSALITLNELPYSELYRDVHDKGVRINRNRRDWRHPKPD